MVHHAQDRQGVEEGLAIDAETIAAQATAPGRGGVGIIRVSGSAAGTIAEALLGRRPRPRYAEYQAFVDADGSPIDDGIALFFPGPNSFTGEDVLELQGHGGPMVMDLLLARVLSLGARLARPGEFTQRAFLNDKMDLAQAEAVADLIDASTEAAARSALRSLRGAFSQRIERLLEELVSLRVFVESAIDFPDEEIDFLADRQVDDRLGVLLASIDEVLATARQGCLLNEGVNLVILGRPNAGKSSLLNAFAGRDTAIVTDIPGTTRDVLRERIELDGMPLHIVDTAGLRESGDAVEQEGIRRAWREVERADHVLLLVDDSQGLSAEEHAVCERLHDVPLTVVRNKIDLTRRTAGLQAEEVPGSSTVAVSIKTGAGMDALKDHLKSALGFRGAETGTFLARRRHLDALASARQAIAHGREQLRATQAGELLAEDLRQAQQALNEITGEFDNEALLDRIFSSFCIGK